MEFMGRKCVLLKAGLPNIRMNDSWILIVGVASSISECFKICSLNRKFVITDI